MVDFLLAAGAFFGLLIILMFSVYIGRRFGQWQMARSALKNVEVVNVAEGAVFALLGLLVAFTFTGAYDRFEARKNFIIEEANAVDTAYLRIDLLPKYTQAKLKDHFKHYVDTRLALYQKHTDFGPLGNKLDRDQLHQIELDIWNDTMSALQTVSNPAVIQLTVSGVNAMFEIANKRLDITELHPPFIIFALLIGLTVMSALLAGYSTAGNKISNSLHILCYVAIMAFIIYVIIDIEYPRHGLIRVNSFDYVLQEARDNM